MSLKKKNVQSFNSSSSSISSKNDYLNKKRKGESIENIKKNLEKEIKIDNKITEEINLKLYHESKKNWFSNLVPLNILRELNTKINKNNIELYRQILIDIEIENDLEKKIIEQTINNLVEPLKEQISPDVLRKSPEEISEQIQNLRYSIVPKHLEKYIPLFSFSMNYINSNEIESIVEFVDKVLNGKFLMQKIYLNSDIEGKIFQLNRIKQYYINCVRDKIKDILIKIFKYLNLQIPEQLGNNYADFLKIYCFNKDPEVDNYFKDNVCKILDDIKKYLLVQTNPVLIVYN